MNKRSTEMTSRRALLQMGAALIAGFATLPLLASFRRAYAAGKLNKADVMYQDKPKAGKDCDDCMHFIPGTTPASNGTCKVVDGVISPHGYCAAFTPRPKHG